MTATMRQNTSRQLACDSVWPPTIAQLRRRPARARLCTRQGHAGGSSGSVVDSAVFGLFHEQHADHEGEAGDDDRVPEATVDITLRSNDRERDGRQEATEPAVADVVREAHRGVA